jgi:hypothetical protein
LSEDLTRSEIQRRQLSEMVERRVTCPFVGSAVLDGLLGTIGAPGCPVASIVELTALGNSGGGDLGLVLAFFARANHGYIPDPTGGAGQPLADDVFSLDFPGSQGSHPGHSGILETSPNIVASGRFDPNAYSRLIEHASPGAGVSRSAIGSFIADNLVRDPNSAVLGFRALNRLALGLTGLVAAAALLGVRQKAGQPGRVRGLDAAVGRLLSADNLVGSAGEFGLLFALLRESPRTTFRGREAFVSVADLESLFVERRLPAGWASWRKSSRSWAWSTICIAAAALFAYRRLTRRPSSD